MSDDEFGKQAAVVGSQLVGFDRPERIAAASRGSANPAALAWLAEGLRLGAGCSVVDLGAGLGGPAAWISDRYDCRILCVEPQFLAARAAVELFGLPMVVGTAKAVPAPDGSFEVALLLGVLSTVDDRRSALIEAARVASRLGVMEYCATAEQAVEAGGSTFPTERQLLDELRGAGWQPGEQTSTSMPAPQTWSAAVDRVDAPTEESEAEVIAAIDAGRIAPLLVIAAR